MQSIRVFNYHLFLNINIYNRKMYSKIIDKLNHLGGGRLVQTKQDSYFQGQYLYVYNNLILILREII